MIKRDWVVFGFGVLIVVFIFGFGIFGEEDFEVDSGDYVDGESLISGIGVSDLDEGEVAGLVLMREEEKLARDVYLRLYEIWGDKIFLNIAGSEQTHMDAVGNLLDRYNISDPIVSDEVGSFSSEEILGLYEELILMGSKSRLWALNAGAMIEDLDIFDLERLLNETDNEDVRVVYENLMKGSRNHLRSYVSRIESSGSVYEAVYISEEEFLRIVGSEIERGVVRLE